MFESTNCNELHWIMFESTNCNELHWIMFESTNCNELHWIMFESTNCNELHWIMFESTNCNELQWIMFELPLCTIMFAKSKVLYFARIASTNLRVFTRTYFRGLLNLCTHFCNFRGISITVFRFEVQHKGWEITPRY